MHWNYFALTKQGREIRGNMQGSRESVCAYLEGNELMPIELAPDYWASFVRLLLKKNLSNESLSVFFRDFTRMSVSGMSILETFEVLSLTTTEPTLKAALITINKSLLEGGSLKEGFERAGVFEKLATSSVAAAEGSGSLPEVLNVLAEYYKYKGETTKRVLGALAYPALVFFAVTIASIIISTKLIPQLRSFLPEAATGSVATKALLSYAAFMEQYWWILLVIPAIVVFIIKALWKDYSSQILERIYALPKLGELLKELEFTTFFLSLGVYLKSGVVLDVAISNIHLSRPTYITTKFTVIRDYVLGGMSFWRAIEKDPFFPPFIKNTIRKGEEQGRLKEYVNDCYKFFEDKSRETINTVVAMINPTLLLVVVSMVSFLILSFFVPLYSGFGNMADQIYK